MNPTRIRQSLVLILCSIHLSIQAAIPSEEDDSSNHIQDATYLMTRSKATAVKTTTTTTTKNTVNRQQVKSSSAESFEESQNQDRQQQQPSYSYGELRFKLLKETIRQRMVEKDHIMLNKWLIDNINDLHRELKQTENDFEHYVQITKTMIADIVATLSIASVPIATIPKSPAIEPARRRSLTLAALTTGGSNTSSTRW